MLEQLDTSDKSSLREKVFATMRESILEGRYKPGEVLRETVIAAELHVSRTPVREAIRKLELEGLVQSIPNKETIVTGISEEDVQDIFKIRNRLEGLAGSMAAERVTKEELVEMEEILTLTAFYIGKEDCSHVLELDHRFHDCIYKATKSKILMHLLSDYHSYIQKVRKQSVEIPGRMQRLLEEHTAIYKAIEEGDGKKAENLMNKHVHNVTTNIKL
ncbi:GntR family transcriptional regulator [Sporanaerobium hydrogeniformans]|uniref:GntR family transcriptional regulator n=1 Tax=Sporanaerobium hydrogeniformans TaxID=3072179 RepID=UPI00269DD03E|nr:GntR family transcriptional regulator [Sporanaerobium hydrogeniformans]